jgi:ElaB/YqjD/DUF883 family membrane-anchored ribosome-binding protein
LKIVLTIILLNLTTILADNTSEVLQYKEEFIGCKAILLKKEKSNCTTKKPKIISIAPIKIPDKKNIKIDKLEKQLTGIKKEFLTYKDNKDNEIKKIFEQLQTLKKELNQYKKTKNKKVKKTKKSYPSKKKKRVATLKKHSKKKRKIHKKKRSQKTKIVTKITEKMPTVNHLPWIDIVVEDNIDIYQLAEKYYGDREEYKKIYVANKEIISRGFKIKNGMFLKIPITEKFEEQPMFLNQ